jgi:hypothetical protein
LFAHSRDDEIIPFKLGRQLSEAAAPPKEIIVLNGSHNDAPWETTPGYFEVLNRFAEQSLSASRVKE